MEEDDNIIHFKGSKSPNNADKNNVDEIREKVRETFSEKEEKLEKEAREGEKDSEDNVTIKKSDAVLIKVKDSFVNLKGRDFRVIGRDIHIFKRVEVVLPNGIKKILVLGLLLGLVFIAGILILSKDYFSLWPQKEAFEQKEEGKISVVAPLYIASKDSRVFHRERCRLAARIYKGNLVTLSSRDEAIRSGRDPCKMCMP